MKVKRFIIVTLMVSLFLGCNLSGDDPITNNLSVLDVHGAGAQRSDPKTGDPADYPEGFGPQGDVIRIYNYVRLVRGNSTIAVDYSVVDTGQVLVFDDASIMIPAPVSGEEFYGQDAQHTGLSPSYTPGTGTVTDDNTGLMWQNSIDSNGDGIINADDKLTHTEALSYADGLPDVNGMGWRLPTVKELYSLILFNGEDISGYEGTDTSGFTPFIDTTKFDIAYGDLSTGDRLIDVQFATSTIYVSTTMNGDETMFGVNFVDGRIKGYGLSVGGTLNTFYVLCVRDDTSSGYGINSFSYNNEDTANETITDSATGLMWDSVDSGGGLNWSQALAWVQTKNAEVYKGYNDWRLPNAKELHNIVDYERSPDTTSSPAINAIFTTTSIIDEDNNTNYPFFWTSTTHKSYRSGFEGTSAVYIAFGEALGFME